jgi:hypothetical protein
LVFRIGDFEIQRSKGSPIIGSAWLRWKRSSTERPDDRSLWKEREREREIVNGDGGVFFLSIEWILIKEREIVQILLKHGKW